MAAIARGAASVAPPPVAPPVYVQPDHREGVVRQANQEGFIPRRVPALEDLYVGDDDEVGWNAMADFRGRGRGRGARPLGYNNDRPRGNNDNQGDDLSHIKMKIPSFEGRSDPDAYLDWEKRVENVFACNHYTEPTKVKLASLEFTDYAMIWWDQFKLSRERCEEAPINNWAEMKAVMRKRFVPSYYYGDLHKRLQRLSQGNRSVEEYFQDMEVMKIRAKVEEPREATIARFLAGLNREIANEVELHHYVTVEDMLHMATKIERQLKRTPQRSRIPGVAPTQRREEASTTPNAVATPSLTAQPYIVEAPSTSGKAPNTTTLRNRDIICYRCQGRGHVASNCPNKRVMVVRDGGYETEEEEEDEAAEDGEFEVRSAVNLVSLRALNASVKEEDTDQRGNIFHTRCRVQEKVCSVVIDGGSCTNVASDYLVEKLSLPTTPHPKPYSLQWLNDSGDIRVSHQVRVPLSIGRYEDEVLYDIVPMEVGHLLLGRPW